MSLGAILVLAIGLAMDATAVAAARGATAWRIRARDVVIVAALFGGFHALMPFLGWLAGARARAVVEQWDHWIAFALLAAIGTRMLWIARRPKPEVARELDRFGWIEVCAIAFATSIDALAVGITLPLMGASLVDSVVMIGGVTAVASIGGLLAGHHLGAVVGRRLEAIGGMVLVVLGTKILVEHLILGR